jgi:hypothetical protein
MQHSAAVDVEVISTQRSGHYHVDVTAETCMLLYSRTACTSPDNGSCQQLCDGGFAFAAKAHARSVMSLGFCNCWHPTQVAAGVAKLKVGAPEDDADITAVVSESSANFIQVRSLPVLACIVLRVCCLNVTDVTCIVYTALL